MTGEQVRDTTFLITSGGYDVTEVDDLLSSIAAELDVGRPVEPLAMNAAFRTRRTGYDVDAVDWFLGQFLFRPGPGDQQAGTYLRLEWVGLARRELRSAEQHTIASMTYRRSDIFLGNHSVSEIGGQLSLNKESFVLKSTGYAQSRKLVDKTGTPILYTSGMNFERRAQASISFPDGRSLRFPVRGTHRANAIMTAVDESGNSVARYRMIRFSTGGSSRKSVEVAVHPSRELTGELMLAIMISAPCLRSYFSVQTGGG